jgi:hypothetical protein
MNKFEKAKDLRLKRTYNLTLRQYNLMLKKQKGVCAICGNPPKKISLAVDHDHLCCKKPPTCGKCTRGLLCFRCNKMVLGRLERFKAQLINIINYLLKYNPKNPLLEGIDGKISK